MLPRLAALTAGLALAACKPAPSAAPQPVTIAIAPASAAPDHTDAPAPPVPPKQASAEEKEEPRRCAPLPELRPGDLVFRFMRHVVPIGGPIVQEGLEVHGGGTPCPAKDGPAAAPVLPCRKVSDATLDGIFHEFKRRRFDAIRPVQTAPGSPHYGSRTLSVVWGDHECTLDDSAWSRPPESEMPGFYALIDAVVGAKP